MNSYLVDILSNAPVMTVTGTALIAMVVEAARKTFNQIQGANVVVLMSEMSASDTDRIRP